jgi:hypothetical protein
MEHKARTLLLAFLGLVLVPIISLMIAFLLYDPLQLYHKTSGRVLTLNSNMRIQAAGLIKHYDFDSVLLGTSVMENYSAKLTGELLHGNFLNISMSGADFFERAKVLEFLLGNKKINKVVYSLDSVYINTRMGYPVFPYSTYEYLYDNNPLNDVRVYLNSHYIACLMAWSSSESCVGRPSDIDRPNAWSGDQEEMRRFGGLNKWCEASGNYMVQDSIAKIKNAAQAVASGATLQVTDNQMRQRVAASLGYVDKYLIDFVKRNPGTNFYLVYPTYSRVQYAFWYQYRTVNSIIHAAVVRHLVAESAGLPNMQVFGFENEAYSDDIANYKDIVHSNPDHDGYILASLANGRGRLTQANVDLYLEESRKKGLEYDLIGLAKKLDQCTQPMMGHGAVND